MSENKRFEKQIELEANRKVNELTQPISTFRKHFNNREKKNLKKRFLFKML